MKFFLPLMLLFFCLTVHAERFKSKIHSIDSSQSKKLPHLVKLENGRVVFVEYNEQQLLNTFKASLRNHDLLEVELDERNNLIRAESLGPEDDMALMSVEDPEPSPAPVTYNPTVLSSYSEASTIFYRMRRDYQSNSQCYNRAHIWQYEEYKKSGLNGLKMFLFFTNRYIRNYRYKWWFHVSPMVLVKEGGSTVQRIIDRRYMGGPRYVRTWTNTFVKSHRACPIAARYRDYSQNQEKEDCYLIPVSQYFWQPRDIVYRDNSGYVKTQFISSEVSHAYWEAF